MKNELPKVYANSINKKFTNTQELFYGRENSRSFNERITFNELQKKIKEIFNSPNHVYKSKVYININGKEEEKTIVGKNEKNLFTLEGEIISLNNIWDIKKRS